MIETLKNEHLILKKLQESDVADFFKAIKDSYNEISPWASWLTMKYSIEDTRHFYQVQFQNWTNNIEFVYKISNSSDEFLGLINLHLYDPNNNVACIGYWMNTQHCGKGYCSSAVSLLIQAGFQWLKLNRIEIIVAISNLASNRVAIKAGGTLESVQKDRVAPNGIAEDANMFVFFPHHS